jgi:hypothetical protein
LESMESRVMLSFAAAEAPPPCPPNDAPTPVRQLERLHFDAAGDTRVGYRGHGLEGGRRESIDQGPHGGDRFPHSDDGSMPGRSIWREPWREPWRDTGGEMLRGAAPVVPPDATIVSAMLVGVEIIVPVTVVQSVSVPRSAATAAPAPPVQAEPVAAAASTTLAAAAASRVASALLPAAHPHVELLDAAATTTITTTTASLTQFLAGGSPAVWSVVNAPLQRVSFSSVSTGQPPRLVDPQQLASAVRTMAVSIVNGAPSIRSAMSDALAFMLATPPTFHIERMGSPWALIADPMAAFAEESASIPVALADGNASADVASAAGSRRAWTITAGVAAADVVVLYYLYHNATAARRTRKAKSPGS